MIGRINGIYLNTVDRVGILVAWIALAIVIVGLVIYLVGKVRLFKKCGQEGWKAIIPFYGDYIFLTQICGLHWAWFVAFVAVGAMSINNNVASALELFVNAAAFYNLGIRCNRDKIAAMIFGAIASPIVTVIYGLTDTITYDKTIEVKESGWF